MSRPVLMPRLMRAAQAAAYLGIGTTTLRETDIPRRVHGACVLYDRDDLDRWADGLPYMDATAGETEEWRAALSDFAGSRNTATTGEGSGATTARPGRRSRQTVA